MPSGRLIGAALLAATVAVGPASQAFAVCDDSLQPEVFLPAQSRTFSSGASWSFQPSRRRCEGLVIYSAFYKPANAASPIQVLARASIAEGHTVYLNPDGERFLDVTEAVDGFGNILDPANATSRVLPVTSLDCPGTQGVNAFFLDDNRVCVRHDDHGLAWKSRNGTKNKQKLTIFMDSQLGAYNYVNLWEFHEDGTIAVKLGLTGSLEITTQFAGEQPRYGQWIDNPAMLGARVGIMHIHNVFYRLDFDIAGPADDQVLRRSFTPSTAGSPDSSCSTVGQCGTVTTSAINTETRQTWSANRDHTWIVQDKVVKNADNRNIGYELRPHISGLWRGQTTDNEKWAGHEMYVTQWNGCELLAARNMSPFISNCGTPAPDLFAMTGGTGTGQNVDGQDVVMWYVARHLHYPRDEDMERMPIEWVSFEIVPRNFHHTNPAP